MNQLEGKVALVTGASRGIGKAIAAAFAAEGAAVMLSSRKQDALDAAAAEIVAQVPGARLATFAANAGEEDQGEASVQATIEQFGALDVLVSNAATNPYYGPTLDMGLSAWDKIFRVNLRGAFALTQSAWHAWMAERGGRVIFISSVGGISSGGGIGAYDVSKAGLNHLAKVLAAEVQPKVNVNVIAPGLVETDFATVLVESLSEKRRGLLMQPEDIAAAAVFLAGPSSARITGQTIVVDSGALALPLFS